MDIEQKEGLIAFYEAELAKYGLDVRSLHWNSIHSQRARFETLCQVGPLKDASILDVGCGLGDLFGYVMEGVKDFRYAGYDISPKMVESARIKYPGAQFFVRDIVQEGVHASFDYVVASGTFNIRVPNHEQYLKDTLTAMYNACTVAVAFNLLAPVDYYWSGDGLFYAVRPGEMLDFCRTLTPQVELQEEYLSGDYTIFMYKSRP
ncbi:MAG: methyltransferase family protein [Dehalococcoidia bacterium]|nr:methyltransferase family protein [Dehalococcoidia bacterium]